MSEQTFHKLTWDQLSQDTLIAAQQIRDTKIDRIVAISRGGLVSARIVADFLSRPISFITMTSYLNMQKVDKPVITECSNLELREESLLLVDEVSDTGETFIAAQEHFQACRPKRIVTFAPYIKPHTKVVPDFYAQSVTSWIIFPYDIRETFEAFTKELGSPKKARHTMKELGFTDWELSATNSSR